MRTAILTLVMCAACSGSEPSDTSKPYENAVQCATPTGAWTVTAGELTASNPRECNTSVTSWDFGSFSSPLSGLECAAGSANHQHNATEGGCHTLDAFSCRVSQNGSRADISVVFNLDYQSDTEQTGTMRVVVDAGSVGKCDGTYSVTLSRE